MENQIYHCDIYSPEYLGYQALPFEPVEGKRIKMNKTLYVISATYYNLGDERFIVTLKPTKTDV